MGPAPSFPNPFSQRNAEGSLVFVQSTFEDVRPRAISVTYVGWWRVGPAIQDIQERETASLGVVLGDWDPDAWLPPTASLIPEPAEVELA